MAARDRSTGEYRREGVGNGVGREALRHRSTSYHDARDGNWGWVSSRRWSKSMNRGIPVSSFTTKGRVGRPSF